MNHKVVAPLPKVKLPTSLQTRSHGVTGGVYQGRERIHRGILITISDSDFMGRVADSIGLTHFMRSLYLAGHTCAAMRRLARVGQPRS